MGVQLQVILITCIVNHVLTFVLLHHEMPYEAHLSDANDETGVRENFQNLLDSVAREDTGKGGTYRRVLKREVANEHQDFDTIKKEFRSIRHSDAHKKDPRDRINAGRKTLVVKRETDNYTFTSSSEALSKAAGDSYNVNPDTFFREIMQRTIELMWAQEGHLIRMKIRESSIRRKSKQSASDMQDLITDTDALFHREMDTLSERFWFPKSTPRYTIPMIAEVYRHFLENWKKFESMVESDFKHRPNVETDCDEIKEEMRKAQADLTAGYEEIKAQMKELEQVRARARKQKKQTV